MLSKILLISAVIVAVCAQSGVPCGFSCSRNTQFFTALDGQTGSITCSDGAGTGRCMGCCQSRGLQSGIDTSNSAGFTSSDGRSCVCCFNNFRCNGGVVPTFTGNTGNTQAAQQQFGK
ncbi:unnamed protein product, partial [Mesorhabditis belari]|uniref:Uncharacterized protein n=1 Tax=Mesorhabditis belari TaxID=2138241 RepID=A0AAF3FBP3_9BILA